MSRIANSFAAAAREKRPAVIPFVTAGDPDLSFTARLIPQLAAAGADILELGVPYSDPLADGPTIQRASQRALQSGTTVSGVLEAVSGARQEGLKVPIVLLVYYNCIYRRGEERFAQEAAAAGVDGLVVPDLPLEEAGSLRQHARGAGLDLIPLVAPTSTPERLALVGQVASGFIYCVSLTGVTGARATLPPDLPEFLSRVRDASGGRVPLAVGFGVSTPDHAREVGRWADGVIVGSALVSRMEQAASAADKLQAAREFVATLRSGSAQAAGMLT